MNPVAKIARGMCFDYLRRKGLDPEDTEDSDEADEALEYVKQTLRRAVEDLSHDDVRGAAPKPRASRAKKQHVASGSTDKVKNEKKEKKEKKAKKKKKNPS